MQEVFGVLGCFFWYGSAGSLFPMVFRRFHSRNRATKTHLFWVRKDDRTNPDTWGVLTGVLFRSTCGAFSWCLSVKVTVKCPVEGRCCDSFVPEHWRGRIPLALERCHRSIEIPECQKGSRGWGWSCREFMRKVWFFIQQKVGTLSKDGCVNRNLVSKSCENRPKNTPTTSGLQNNYTFL